MNKFFFFTLLTLFYNNLLSQTYSAEHNYVTYSINRLSATTFNLKKEFYDGSICTSILTLKSSTVLQPSGYKKEIYTEKITSSENSDCSIWYQVEITWHKPEKINGYTYDFFFKVLKDNSDNISDLDLFFYKK